MASTTRTRYIGSATLDGKPLDRAYLRHDEILAGGELRFTMQARPNTAWARTQRPYSMSHAAAP